jgi:alpha-L-fucosidase
MPLKALRNTLGAFYTIYNMRILISVIFATLLMGCAQKREVLYTQHVIFPEDATIEERLDMAARVVPSDKQLAWQELELTAFIHFGINTFTGNEWGSGKESPAQFTPTALDCEQWVLALKRGGFKMVILTAKHHDGFCLWPTKSTDHSVVHSPWREGKGDVVRELSEACRKHNMKFGFYLSPWDRNAKSYGDSPAYNDLFIEQLTELLTGYGKVDEVWFDGACGEGPNGKRQVYDWKRILATVERLQPDAVTAIMGDDVRWVGNEGGRGRETEWSATPYTPLSLPNGPEANGELGLEEMSSDLGSRELVARAKGINWYPSEVDVSIRPGWFYHAEEDAAVRTLANLVDIYYTSVGRNSVLLLNIPPDRRGLIHEIDAERIAAFNDYIEATFAKSLIHGCVRPWHAEEGDSNEYRIKRGEVVNTILLQEDIRRGQRVEHFTIEAFYDGEWHNIAEGTTIGYKRLLRFEECRAERIRVTIDECRTSAHIANVGLYYAEPLQ